MAQADLNVTARERLGKGGARALRREGMVPAVVYGKGMDPCSLVVNPKDLTEAIETEAGWNILITLKGEQNVDGKVVILKDMQVEPIRQDILHADFQTIDMSEEISVTVPVHPVGKSAGEKMGGNLQVIRHELEIYCLPDAIPSAIDVDVTEMNIGDVIHVEDLTLPPGVEVPHDVNFTVITVTGRKEEEAAEEAETEEETSEI